ncbi:hypothetical protein BaRGS_00000354, partial [Batillaria attramentaria]
KPMNLKPKSDTAWKIEGAGTVFLGMRRIFTRTPACARSDRQQRTVAVASGHGKLISLLGDALMHEIMTDAACLRLTVTLNERTRRACKCWSSRGEHYPTLHTLAAPDVHVKPVFLIDV